MCGNKVGALSRFKLKDGEFMCSDCRKYGSPFMHMAYMTKDQVAQLFEEMKQHEAHFQQEKFNYRKFSRATIGKSWTILDNFQNGEFVLETPEMHGYENHFVFKMDQVFPFEKADQFLELRSLLVVFLGSSIGGIRGKKSNRIIN